MAVPSINLKMIRLGKTKKIEGKYKYKTTPIIYDEYPFEMVVYGYSKFFSFPNALSIGLDIDKNNEDFLKVLRKKFPIFMEKNYISSKRKELMQNSMSKMEKFKHQLEYFLMTQR